MTRSSELCPFCQKDIEPNTTICPHCHRGLAGKALLTPTAAPRTRWGRVLLILAAIVAIPVLMVQCSADHQRYVQFSEQRDAWHRKCDAYRDVKVGDPRAPIAAACQRELNELTAYAKQHGWMK